VSESLTCKQPVHRPYSTDRGSPPIMDRQVTCDAPADVLDPVRKVCVACGAIDGNHSTYECQASPVYQEMRIKGTFCRNGHMMPFV